jgi:hypothetical protein
MLETDIANVCQQIGPASGYSLRSILVYFYHCQLQETEETREVFAAFFKLRRDATWCRQQTQATGSDILWPPLRVLPPPTTIDPRIRIVCVRGRVFIPIIPVVMDHVGLRSCLVLYGV